MLKHLAAVAPTAQPVARDTEPADFPVTGIGHQAVEGSAALPIATAPVAAGVAYGPVLLYPGCAAMKSEEWAVGAWNGRQWHDLLGELCWPTH